MDRSFGSGDESEELFDSSKKRAWQASMNSGQVEYCAVWIIGSSVSWIAGLGSKSASSASI